MYYYECFKCKSKVAGVPENPELDPVVMMADEKPNTFIFFCEECFESLENGEDLSHCVV